MYAANKLVI